MQKAYLIDNLRTTGPNVFKLGKEAGDD